MTPKEFKGITGKTLGAVHTFESTEDFVAIGQVEKFLEERGFSLGRMARDLPMGVKRGEWDIQKWHNLSTDDRLKLDGLVVGDKRNGPVTIIFAKGEQS